MSNQEGDLSSIDVRIRNIGGISETAVTLSPGVTVLSGRNATNRTSFLRAIMAALGSDDAALKGDTDEGSVELAFAGERYRRTLSRRGGTTVFGGDPYLDAPESADLFAFLLESNDARRSVERGDDLHDVIMRPVDTVEIEAEIDRLEAERRSLTADVASLDALADELPATESRRADVEQALADKRAELEAAVDALEALEAEREEAASFESELEALREARRELEGVRADIDDERHIIEALETERADVAADLEGLAEADATEERDLEGAIAERRADVQAIESTIAEFQSAISFNESMLEEGGSALVDTIGGAAAGDGGGDITDQLVADGEVVCWTCGSQVDRAQIEGTLDLLRQSHREKIQRRADLREEISELEGERKHIERTLEERRRRRRRLDDVEAELAERTDRLDALAAEAADLEATTAALEAEVDAIETDDDADRLEAHRTVTELEIERDRLEAQLASLDDEIAEVEQRLAERAAIEGRLDEIDASLDELHSRIERLETEAVEAFNDQMTAIIDRLAFDNLERVWIERVERDVREGRQTVTKATFDLHVIRATEAGAVYEDTVDHLSESEREVVGLVFALSGYLVHEVYDQVPFMVLDSLEAIDSDRIATLVDYLSQYAPNLVVALLPEDAAAVDETYERVADI